MMSRERANDAAAVRGEESEESRVPGPGHRSDPGTVTDTFTLLSNETRVRIVRALDEASEDGPLRFSELRSEVGVRDGGRFNYHLDKLRGQLVEKTDDGYALSSDGKRVADIV